MHGPTNVENCVLGRGRGLIDGNFRNLPVEAQANHEECQSELATCRPGIEPVTCRMEVTSFTAFVSICGDESTYFGI